MSYTIVFTPEAREQIVALYRYIAAAASPEIAERYTSAIITYCESLNTFPHRGNCRDDIRPGLRITNYKKRAVIAFMWPLNRFLSLVYGGQDYEAVLEDDSDDEV